MNLPRGNWLPGTWNGFDFEGGRCANITCPNGHSFSLLNHKIADTGVVSPSVVCPEEGCGFHEHLKLRGWSPTVDPGDGLPYKPVEQ